MTLPSQSSAIQFCRHPSITSIALNRDKKTAHTSYILALMHHTKLQRDVSHTQRDLSTFALLCSQKNLSSLKGYFIGFIIFRRMPTVEMNTFHEVYFGCVCVPTVCVCEPLCYMYEHYHYKESIVCKITEKRESNVCPQFFENRYASREVLTKT